MENETMIHPETGELLRRDVRLIEFKFKGEPFTVNMLGWYPENNNNGIFSQEDLKVSDAAVDALLARHKKLQRKKIFWSLIRF